MEMTSTQATLVDRDFPEGVTATLPRDEFAAALSSEKPAELFLELTRPDSGEKKEIAVSWNREELERLLASATGPTVTLTFDRDQLEQAIDPEVEMHGLKESALVLSVAAAAAFGGASAAAAAPLEGASLTAGGITPSYVAVHDEATLAARGIQPVVASSHDEATLAARGIETPVASSHDEATLASRGIEPGYLPASHDEASLVARGIEPAPTTGDDGGFAIEAPNVDPATVAAIGGGLAGLGLLITAAGFATRRQRSSGHPA
jgi:hypothetical protein